MTRGSESIGSCDRTSHNTRLMRLRKAFVCLPPLWSVCLPYCSGYKRGSGQWCMQRSAESTCGFQRNAEARRRRAHLALDCLCVYVCTPAQEQAASKQPMDGKRDQQSQYEGRGSTTDYQRIPVPPSVFSLSGTPQPDDITRAMNNWREGGRLT